MTTYIFESKEALIHSVLCKNENAYLTESEDYAFNQITRIVNSFFDVRFYSDDRICPYPGASADDKDEMIRELFRKLFKDAVSDYINN